MRSHLNTAVSAVVTFLLALLGFSSCTDTDDGGGRTEYGTPSAWYKVRGTAVDKSTETPVEGLRAVLYYEQEYEGRLRIGPADTVFTDQNGAFEMQLYTSPTDKLFMVVEDVDGEKNGFFSPYRGELDFKDAKYSDGSGNWYIGETEKNMGVIYLDEGNPEETQEPGVVD